MSERQPIIDLRIDGEPVAKERPRFGKGGRVYTPQTTKSAENTIGWRIKERYEGIVPHEGIVELHCAFHTKKDRPQPGSHHSPGKKDLDNLVKLVKDALNDIVYVDDWQVERIVCDLYPGSPDPHTQIAVYVLDR